MEIHILTLFPEVLEPFLGSSLLGKARDKGIVQFYLHQIRDYALDRHARVDDAPAGGGSGMLLKVDVLHRAWKAAGGESPLSKTVLLTPQGRVLNQEWAKAQASWFSGSSARRLILVAGHYEGVDERFIHLCVDEELSIGNYVLTGGELPGPCGVGSSNSSSAWSGRANGVCSNRFLRVWFTQACAVHPSSGIPRYGHPGSIAFWKSSRN